MQRVFFKNRFLVAIYIFIFSFLLFSPSLKSDFIWDDVIEIKKQYYKFKNVNFTKSLIPKKSQNRTPSYYRPVAHFSLYYDYKKWSDDPFGYHLTNIVLYALCSVLVYFLFLLILKRFGIPNRETVALFSTLLFVVHPMHVESVSWIAGRSDVLCSMFFLAAFATHILSNKSFYYLVLTASFLYLSLLSKEIAVAFPFVVLAFDLIADKKLKRQSFVKFLLYLFLVLIYLYLKGRSHLNVPNLSSETLGESVNSGSKFWEFLSATKVIFSAYLFYFYKLIFPFKFNAFITKVPQGSTNIVFSILAFIGLLTVFIYSIRKKSGIKAFCIVWLLLTLGPSVLVAIFTISTTPLAERYLFLPIASFSLLIGYLVYQLYEIKSFRKPVFVVSILVFLCCLLFTVSRQYVWRDRLTFWADAASKSYYSAIPHINYGMVLIDEGKFDEGIERLEISFKPELKTPSIMRSIAANNLGIAYLNKGDINKAKEWFLKGVNYNPSFYKSYYHLGLVHYGHGQKGSFHDLQKAEKYLKKAITIKKRYALAYLLLAEIYVSYGDIDTAKNYARTALNQGLIEPLENKAKAILNM